VKPWQHKQWCIAEVTPAFLWRMEDVLDQYAEPYDPRRPQLCVDELSYQLLSHLRDPLPAAPGRAAKVDYEYHREGTCNLFVALEPLAGRRVVEVTARRTAVDFAHFLRHLIDDCYPEAEVLRLVLDNLNTHTPACLYEAFPAPEAWRLTRKLELHYTPRHASWLNMVEIEIGVLKRQCLRRRLPDSATVRREIAACVAARNAARARVEWQFTTDKARVKLARYYEL
jgi:hypothetical protein